MTRFPAANRRRAYCYELPPDRMAASYLNDSS
jgi:hypothetical protein